MDRLNRLMFFVTTAAMLGLATNALAEWGDPGCGHGMQMDRQQMEQMRERRQTLLHDSLQLTPEQEKAWTAFAAKHKELHPGEPAERQAFAGLHAPERMEKMLERLRAHEARMSKMLEALKEFYAVLTPRQQKIFDEFMPAAGGHGNHLHEQ